MRGLSVDDPIRLTVLYSGRVQGVGFRYTARSVASGFDVTGYVRNLPDGRVELVAEGSPAEVRAFVASVERELGVHIRDVNINEEPPTGRFTDFSIRH
jgi:acylphosphatase